MLSRIVLSILLLGSLSLELSAQNRSWDLDQERASAKEQQSQDSLAIAQRKYLYQSNLYFKTEFPIQLALGYQFTGKKGISFHASTGLYPAAFTRVLLNQAPAETQAEADFQAFISDRLQNGSVNEIGFGYTSLQSGLYALISLQFQRFSIETTTNELIENLDTELDAATLEEQFEALPALENFFYEESIYPTFRPTNLVLSVGKTFRFAAIPRFSLSTHLSYGINLSSSLQVEANSFIGNTVANSFINPGLASSNQNIAFRGLPSLSLRVNYHFGGMVR
ncbi:MAG: hypothetical protein AAFQ87_27240 [Bacteroidota bacterium]